MPVLGGCTLITQAATLLSAGGAATVIIPLRNNAFARLIAVLATYVTTADAGNRVVVMQVKDSSGNILWMAAQGGNIVASKTTYLAYGGGAPLAAPTVPLLVTMPLPVDMIVPISSTLTFFDNAAINTGDTVAASILLSY